MTPPTKHQDNDDDNDDDDDDDCRGEKNYLGWSQWQGMMQICKFAIWCLMDFKLRRDCQWTTCAPGTLWAELGWPLHSSTDRNLQIALMEGPSRNGKQEIELLTLLVNGIVGEHMQLPMCSAKQRMDKRRRSLNTAASTVLMMQLSDFVRCLHL